MLRFFELDLAKDITSARVWPGGYGSRLNGQMVGQRRHGKGAAGLCTGFERLGDGIADEFLDCLFHGTCSECLVNTAPDKELECLLWDPKIKALLSKPGEFLENGELANLALRVWRKRFEDDLFVKAPDEFRSEEFVQFGNHRAFQGREWKPGWTQKPLGANVARADEVKAGKIVGSVIVKRNPGGIEHL